jgi:hypothetical protein
MKAVLAGALACLLAFSATLAAVEMGAFGAEETPVTALMDDGPPRMEPLSAREVEARTAERPEWRVGDAWLVRFNEDFACWLVVGEVRNGTYVQGTSCDGEMDAGAQIAANDFAYAGTFDRDLARPTRSDGTIRLYDWPLTDGKTWTTSWFGEEVTVRAAFDEEIEGPLGEEPGFVLRMSYGDAEDEFLRYDYVPSLRWWSEFRFESGAVVTVEDAVRGWGGRVVMVDAEERVRFGGSGVLGPAATRSFAVSEADDALIIEVRASGRAVLMELALRDPDGSSQYSISRRALTGGSSYNFDVVADLQPGSWVLEETFIGDGSVDAVVHALRIDVRSL